MDYFLSSSSHQAFQNSVALSLGSTLIELSSKTISNEVPSTAQRSPPKQFSEGDQSTGEVHVSSRPVVPLGNCRLIPASRARRARICPLDSSLFRPEGSLRNCSQAP